MKYCLIGEKLGHSYSAELHRAMGFDYSLVEVNKDALAEFLANNDYDGFNVTIPFKKAVIDHLDRLDNSARLTGAVNTVKRDGNLLVGYNTDIDGMSYMIESTGVSLKDKNVLILGSGGTSGTAQALAIVKGAKSINVVSRTGKINYTSCYELSDTQIIINTTPVGMFPDVYKKPIELSRFKNLIAVFDCVYNPFRTKLIQEANALGLICSDGLPMLVRQAVLAQNLWNNKKDDPKTTKTLVSTMRAKKANIVLFGMPSSGKTTLGGILAEKYGKPFIDLDEYIAEKHGKSPAEMIRENGEQFFRQAESAAVAEVAPLSGRIIALGGGTVLDQSNVKKLKMNGVMIYIKRDLNLLTTENRPLSLLHGVERLFAERKEIYKSAADAQVENNSDPDYAVKEIEKAYESACNQWC